MNSSRIGPDVAIIILNWNGSSDTLECLRTLFDSDARMARVVVFDNGSHPEDRAQLESFPGIEFFASTKNLGFAEGNNEAVRMLGPEAKRLVFLNNDTEVPTVWLAPLLETMEAKSPAIVSPAIFRGTPDDLEEWWFSGARIVWPLGRPVLETSAPPSEAKRLPYVPGCCMALSRESWESLGGFDSRYFAYFEDTDICLRAATKGIGSWIEPGCRIWHKVSRATGEYSPFRIELFTRNRILFMRRFASLLHFLSFFASQVALRFAYSLKYLARPDGFILYKAFLRGVKRGFSEKDWQ